MEDITVEDENQNDINLLTFHGEDEWATDTDQAEIDIVLKSQASINKPFLLAPPRRSLMLVPTPRSRGRGDLGILKQTYVNGHSESISLLIFVYATTHIKVTRQCNDGGPGRHDAVTGDGVLSGFTAVAAVYGDHGVARILSFCCLEEAWAVLGHHSTVHNCTDPSSLEDDFLDDSATFGMLRSLFVYSTSRRTNILLGQFQDVIFDSWPEALCAELLYVRPLICMGDVSVRGARTMSDFGHPPQPSSEGDSTFEEIVLNLMRGNAGSAVMALHKFGGGSGSA
eukprot:scaffold4330_cov38-Attheya_sp.AAC.5